jgi:hypothetical protein
MALERELATFQANLPNLLATAAGKYVLIHDGNIAGTWDTWREALNAGHEQFDLGPFLVKQIVADEQPILSWFSLIWKNGVVVLAGKGQAQVPVVAIVNSPVSVATDSSSLFRGCK